MILDLDLGRTIKKLNVCITFSFLYNNVNVWPIEEKKAADTKERIQSFIL